ncbi:LacI family DNA-binding transcriptional regulator, partial [Streptomyces sp. Ru72]
MATMADVARSAGVSVATVSHVLNGTRPVLPRTRQAVLDAIDEL